MRLAGSGKRLRDTVTFSRAEEKRRSPAAIALRVAPLGGLLLAGCASATLGQGITLSKAGQTAAQQIEQNAVLSADSITALRRAVAFNDGYAGAIGNPASAGFLQHMRSIQGKQRAYAQLLGSLANAYAALGDLAAYDSAGSFNTAISALAGDASKFGNAVGAKIEIPSQVVQGVSTVGGLALSELRARRVKTASGKIETILKTVIAVLDDPHTRTLLIPAEEQTTGVIDQATDSLLLSGVYGGYAAIADQLGAPLGLKTNDKAEAEIASDAEPMPKVRAGLRNVIVELGAERTEQVGASYDASLKALRALLPLHEKLAKGAPLDLSGAADVTAQLQSIAASLQPSPQSAKGK